MTYRDRREARAERLREWADKRETKAGAAFDQAHRMSSAIPFGQPILVGHHSEKRDRNYRDRIGRNMDKGIEHTRKAEEMSSKARNIESALDRAIYRDDHDAIEKLEERIADLEAERARIVAFNKTARKGTPDYDLLDEHQRADLASLVRIGFDRNGAFPAYATSNLSGRITKDRQRLERLR